MKRNAYTLFLELLRNDSPQLREIFRQGCYCMPDGPSADGLVAEGVSDVAREKMHAVLDVLRSREMDVGEKVRQVKVLLNTRGLIKLSELFLSYSSHFDDRLVDGMVDTAVKGLFTDIPPFDVEVTEDFRIFLVGNGRRELTFRSFNARILYIFMLLQSGRSISKRRGAESFRRRSGEILELALKFLKIGRGKYEPSIMRLENLLDEGKIDVERSGSRLRRTGLDEFLSQSRSIANGSVLKTIGDEEVAAWYVIEKDNLSETYSISLPPEHILLPQNLAKFIKKT